MTKSLITAAIAVLFSQALLANAGISTTLTAGPTSSEVGAITTDFNASNALPTGYTGGAVFSASTSESAQPPGSTGNFYTVGTASNQAGPGVVTFATPVSYFGFLWGSPDKYNTVEYYNGATLIGSYTGDAALDPANGDQGFATFFNAYATGGDVITSVHFISTGNAFETDNHAVIAAVPEPETYAMMLAGLGLMGFAARRRSN